MQVIAFGSEWDVAKAVQAVKFGAKEVCVFPASGNELKKAINQILTENRRESIPLDEKIPRSISDSLAAEEAVILRLIVQGRTAKEVGSTLDISVRTFHYRKKSIFAKLGVKNRSEAIELIRRSVEGL
jgi:DNA-binding NarL/FixJ family response regulator